MDATAKKTSSAAGHSRKSASTSSSSSPTKTTSGGKHKSHRTTPTHIRSASSSTTTTPSSSNLPSIAAAATTAAAAAAAASSAKSSPTSRLSPASPPNTGTASESTQPRPPTAHTTTGVAATGGLNKMAMSTLISPSPAQAPTRLSMTSKEWVIPPRPKPGRKPATDTPPTKRKAQNRAAQRAFRERRAARVGELEEQLDQEREVQAKEQDNLKTRIHDLELELQSFRSKCSLLESLLERERQDRMRAERQAESASRRHLESSSRGSPFHQPPLDTTQRHTSFRHASNPSSSHQHSHVHTSLETPHGPSDTVAFGCSSCSSGGQCACANTAALPPECGQCGFGPDCKCLNDVAKAFNNNTQELKRSVSPSNLMPSEKRHRQSHDHTTEGPTASGSSTTLPHHQHHSVSDSLQDSSLDTSMPKDSCGFCKDGTYCMCAEDAKAASQSMEATTLAPITNQTQTPPPSESDANPAPTSVSASASAPIPMEMTAEGAVKLPRRAPKPSQSRPLQAKSTGCGPNGPGTCAQCQADPKSGLFCRLMAANLSGGVGCCGGKGSDGSCCKSNSSNSASTQDKPTLPSLPSLGLSCADAYQTLSSHRNFARAADDIGSWLPKLKTTPVRDLPGATSAARSQSGRMPMEVEAASIMSVLKDFDVRFSGQGS